MHVVELAERTDDRDLFARAFRVHEFGALGLERRVARAISYNRRTGTVRGLHRQVAPAYEAKYFRCTTEWRRLAAGASEKDRSWPLLATSEEGK